MVERLTEEYTVSATPVREALIRLASEQLIDDVPKAGFFQKALSESEISELFELQQMVLERSLQTIDCGERTFGILKPPDLCSSISRAPERLPEAFARVTSELFTHLTRQSGKTNFIHLIGNINDRTHYIRKKDFELFGDKGDVLNGLCESYRQKDFPALGGGLGAYFRQRLDRLPDLLRALRGAKLRDSA